MDDSQRTPRLSLIKEIAQSIGAASGLPSVIEGAVQLVQGSFGVHHAAFLQVDAERGDLEMSACAGAFADLFPPHYRLRSDQGLVGWVCSHGGALLVNDVRSESRYEALPPGVVGTRSEVCVGVRVGEEVLGVLDVQSDRVDAFDANDMEVLETVGSQLGVAFENDRLYASIQQASADRRRADGALWESEKRFRAIAETADDAVVVFDSRENIFFWNPAAKSIFGYEAGETQGKVLDSIVSPRFREVLREEMGRVVARKKADLVGTTLEMGGIRKDGREFPIELSLATWRTKEEVFFTVIARDITQRKEVEAERERLIKELQDALTEIKTLRGIIPICASCKKVRDDEGYWEQVEVYVRDRSDAEFSHSLCPECAKELYGDFLTDEDIQRFEVK